MSVTLVGRRGSGPSLAATERGAVEYAERGAGADVLILHGVPGGFDQGLIVGRLLDGAPYHVVAVSRPGYLGTPIATGATPEAQADAYAALLDTLGIERVAAIAFSGGGPSTLQFVLRHPDRCWALVTLAALTMRRPVTGSPLESLARWLPLSDRGSWPLAKLVNAIPEGLAQKVGIHPLALALFGNALQAPARGTGIRNDLAQFDEMPPYPLQQIAAPTLVIHGLRDRVVPIAHADHAAGAIPGVRVVRVRGAGHVLLTSPEVRTALLAFLSEHAPA